MGLRVRDRARYARQLLLPQIGELGQARLLAAELAQPAGADPGAAAVARAYLERAGVRVREAPSTPSNEAGPLALPSEAELASLAGRPELHEAARALCGALGAVRAIQSLVRVRSRESDSPLPAFRIPVLSSEEP